MYMGYTITKQSGYEEHGARVAEYIFEGKRGATYESYRNPNSNQFQVRRTSTKFFTALKGNYTFRVDHIEPHAFEFTEADRVA